MPEIMYCLKLTYKSKFKSQTSYIGFLINELRDDQKNINESLLRGSSILKRSSPFDLGEWIGGTLEKILKTKEISCDRPSDIPEFLISEIGYYRFQGLNPDEKEEFNKGIIKEKIDGVK